MGSGRGRGDRRKRRRACNHRRSGRRSRRCAVGRRRSTRCDGDRRGSFGPSLARSRATARCSARSGDSSSGAGRRSRGMPCTALVSGCKKNRKQSGLQGEDGGGFKAGYGGGRAGGSSHANPCAFGKGVVGEAGPGGCRLTQLERWNSGGCAGRLTGRGLVRVPFCIGCQLGLQRWSAHQGSPAT